MAERRPESGFSAERSQLYSSALFANPDKTINLKGVSQSLFCIADDISYYDVAQ
jgi:hypothetical protein